MSRPIPIAAYFRGAQIAALACVTHFAGAPSATAQAPGTLDGLNADVVGNTFDSFVMATAVQPDGRTIIAGKFLSVLGVPRKNIARLNANGSLDMGFNPNANDSVICVAVQADGKILLGGVFTTLQPNGAVGETEHDPNALATGWCLTGGLPSNFRAKYRRRHDLDASRQWHAGGDDGQLADYRPLSPGQRSASGSRPDDEWHRQRRFRTG